MESVEVPNPEMWKVYISFIWKCLIILVFYVAPLLIVPTFFLNTKYEYLINSNVLINVLDSSGALFSELPSSEHYL